MYDYDPVADMEGAYEASLEAEAEAEAQANAEAEEAEYLNTDQEMPTDPYEVRKFFEATLSDLAKLYGENPKEFREFCKAYLRRKGVINNSTSELPIDHMYMLAKQISKFVYVMTEHTPPDEIALLNDNLFQLIFKEDVKTNNERPVL